jgi:aspartate kinase
VQNVSHEGATDLSFTAPIADVASLEAAVEGIARQVGARDWSVDHGVAKVSLVGAGMKSQPGVAADMFDALAAEGINIEMISTSPIRISCVVRKTDADRALRVVHERFGLDVSPQMSDN